MLEAKDSALGYDDLLSVRSLGPAKAIQIMAGFEPWCRQFEVSGRSIIDSPERLQNAGKLLGIKLVDHIIVAVKGYSTI